jgi:S-DNA-T family DNA segregation ATPase FtsK/SpoIIIE
MTHKNQIIVHEIDSEKLQGKYEAQLLKRPCVMDCRLHPETLRFVLYILGEELVSFSLTSSRPHVSFAGLTCRIEEGKLFVNDEHLEHGLAQVGGLKLFIVDTAQAHTMGLRLYDQADFTLGSESYASIRFEDCTSRVIYHEGKVLVSAKAEDDFVYYNSEKLSGHCALDDFQIGDQILTKEYLLEKRPDQWKLTFLTDKFELAYDTSFVPMKLIQEAPEDFPEYRRSPRLHLEVPELSFDLQKEEKPEAAPKGGLLKAILPPIIMIGAMLGVSFLIGRNPLLMIGMGMMSLVTGIFTATSFLSEKKARKIRNEEKKDNYESYFFGEVGKIATAYKKEAEILRYQNPSPDELGDKIDHFDARIYERMVGHKDFLDVSLGLGEKASQLKLKSQLRPQDQDENTKLIQKVLTAYQTERSVPEVLKLREQTLGFVGPYLYTCPEVQKVLFQLAFFHSYRDVNFMALVPEESYEADWAQWRFLPHFQLQELGMRGIIKDAGTRDLVLNSFTQLLAKRRQTLKEAGKEVVTFLPHIILAIFEDKWLSGHGLNEYLAEDMSALGVTVIWVKEDQNLLPETVSAIVDYRFAGKGTLINDHHAFVKKDFVIYPMPVVKYVSRNRVTSDFEYLIRKLAGLHHVEVEKNAIPMKVSYLDLYKVKEVEQLNIQARWAKADTSKTLAVPIGLRGKDDLVMLNLHERADGPHALAGGTTGAGKSELVQTYVLSLATHFAPEDVSFLIIDFKGGGMSSLFKNLPHLMGTITNLDGKGMDRAFASINAELEHRQALFAQYGVNHINGYTRLYKLGKAETDPEEKAKFPSEPLPHLFLLMDEAREVKEDNPDNMAKIDSIGRIGRSLGVHNLPSTQKPSGTFSDQFFANTKTKILLRVADTADSQEVLKTHDAAFITEPGRAYLQVGNNERYELFQSAYSGAEYEPNPVEKKQKQLLIYKINDLGQRELLTQDLSSDEEVEEIKKESVTELDVVVELIARVAKETNAVIPKKPWLPALSEHYVTPDVTNTGQRNLKIPLGLLDIPTQQLQLPYFYDLAEASHTAIYSSPGYGKSTTLQTIVMNLARQNTPEQVQFNLLDFGTNGLLPLKDLPHVADIVRLDEREKLEKMLNRMTDIIEGRKLLFQEAGVSSFQQYELKTGIQLPVVINVLDTYDALSDDTRRERIDSVLTQVMRDGQSMGTYLLFTSGRQNYAHMSLRAYIGTAMTLLMGNDADLMEVFGKEKLPQVEVSGRGQVRNGFVQEIQYYLPNDGDNSLAIIQKIQAETEVMNLAWEGGRPIPLPVVPMEFEQSHWLESESVKDFRRNKGLPLALALSDTRAVGYDFKRHNLFLMAYTSEEQKMNQRQTLLDEIRALEISSILFDFEGEVDNPEVFTMVCTLENMEIGLERLKYYVDHEGRDALVVIPDLESFFKQTKMTMIAFRELVDRASKRGLHILIHSDHDIVNAFGSQLQDIRKLAFAGFVGETINNTNILQGNASNKEPFMMDNEGYYYEKKGRFYEKARTKGPRRRK